MTPTDSAIQLRAADPNRADEIAAIYNHYIANSTVTFEEDVVDAKQMAARIHDVFAKGLPWFVATEGEVTVGYAYASPWRIRTAYSRSVEVTAYLAPQHRRKGIGTILYSALLHLLQQGGFHTAIGVIALPNHGSVRLHEHFRFEKAAHLKQVGYKMGRWVDVGYWQLLLQPVKDAFPPQEI